MINKKITKPKKLLYYLQKNHKKHIFKMVKTTQLTCNQYEPTFPVPIIHASIETRKRSHEIDDNDEKKFGQTQNKRRKMATQREKKRQAKLNTCIEEIKKMVCPDMTTPTKAKILSVAINRLEYLEKFGK